jgi:hypothetical protein
MRTESVMRRLSEADPAREAVPASEASEALLARILSDASDERQFRHAPAARRHRAMSSRALLAVALPGLAVLTLVLVIAGVFSGPASTGTQPAAAAVIRGVENAIAPKPGTIVVSKYRVTGSWEGAPPGGFTVENVYETPTGPGPQNSLGITTEHLSGVPSEQAVSGGNEEVYLSRTNTIYISSIWGPFITKGKKAGTFIFTPAKAPQGPPLGPPATLVPAKPLVLTARQAHALLDGTDRVIANVSYPNHVPNLAQGRWVLSLAPVAHYPTATQVFRSLLKAHDIRVVGLTTVDGRAAIKLAGPKFDRRLPSDGGADAGVEVWVDPKTYVPIKEVDDRLPLFETIETWIEYKTLPITTVNEQLVSLIARHPHARIDRARNDYLRAANGDVPFPG